MRLLLDTHILLDLLTVGINRLQAGIQDALRDPTNEHHLSAASLWEIAIKSRLGKLRLTVELAVLPELLEDLGIEILPINEQHALASVDPEPETCDPFDRMLLAQCMLEGMRLVTADRALIAHPAALKP